VLNRKFIQDTTHQILSKSAEFYRRYDKNILVHFFLTHSVYLFFNIQPVFNAHIICSFPRMEIMKRKYRGQAVKNNLMIFSCFTERKSVKERQLLWDIILFAVTLQSSKGKPDT